MSIKKVTVVYLFLCLLVPNVKLYFLLSTLYVSFTFWITKSWTKTIVYCYLPLSFYYVGQLYVFRVIQPEELNHPLYPDGRSIYFKFTPLIVLCSSIIVTWMVKLLSQKIKINWLIIVLLLGVICRQISGANGGIIPWWVHLGNTISDFSVVLWLWWVIDYLNKAKNFEKITFWTYFTSILKTIIIIGSILIVIQGTKGSGLGLTVEQSGILPYSRSGSDSGWLIRPIGLWTHANEAAYSILCFLLAWYLIKFYKENKTELMEQKWLLWPIIAVIWLQSRSVFLAIIPFLIWWLHFYGKNMKLFFKKIKLNFWNLIIGMSVMFLMALVIADRFWNSLTNFGEYSGWDTRGKLLSVAIRVFKSHFWWGIGKGNFIAVAFREDLSNIMKSFPEAVHNGWMLILVEQGIIGTIIWIVFLIILTVEWWWFTKNKKELRWFLIVLIVSQSLVMFFQPFDNVLTLGLMLSVILLASEKNKK